MLASNATASPGTVNLSNRNDSMIHQQWTFRQLGSYNTIINNATRLYLDGESTATAGDIRVFGSIICFLQLVPATIMKLTLDMFSKAMENSLFPHPIKSMNSPQPSALHRYLDSAPNYIYLLLQCLFLFFYLVFKRYSHVHIHAYAPIT